MVTTILFYHSHQSTCHLGPHSFFICRRHYPLGVRKTGAKESLRLFKRPSVHLWPDKIMTVYNSISLRPHISPCFSYHLFSPSLLPILTWGLFQVFLGYGWGRKVSHFCSFILFIFIKEYKMASCLNKEWLWENVEEKQRRVKKKCSTRLKTTHDLIHLRYYLGLKKRKQVYSR